MSDHQPMTIKLHWLYLLIMPSACMAGAFFAGRGSVREAIVTPPSDGAALDAALQSQAVCQAVSERMGITVTLPPWQAMVLTPILDPR